MSEDNIMKIIRMLFIIILILTITSAFQMTVCDFRWPDIGIIDETI